MVWEQTLITDGFVLGIFPSFLLNSHILPIISSVLFQIKTGGVSILTSFAEYFFVVVVLSRKENKQTSTS